MKFEVIETRPASLRGGKWVPLATAVKETVSSGGSVRLTLNGDKPHNVYQALRHIVRPGGLMVRYRLEGDQMLLWAVRAKK